MLPDNHNETFFYFKSQPPQNPQLKQQMVNLRKKMLERQAQQLAATMLSSLRATQIVKETSPRIGHDAFSPRSQSPLMD